jgi:hypothetical protein
MKLYYLILVISLFLLSSCDPASRDIYVINNFSNQNLNIYYETTFHATSRDTIYIDTILPNTKKEIFNQLNFPSRPNDNGDEFLIYFDSLYINPIDTNFKISKKIHDRKNWDYCENDKCNERKKAIYSKYILTISNSDF